ncbi:uncharacterized protein LOC122945372 [Bufo gargarizans]|uniref:uncharacterized protein LOC122945372 n=1 Tax=Bufo gargarizans TaxID=30331 RepID=UPI001CF5A9E4|nr:uncharacterized protein LOC122945372 [Bufo gargarizans]
MASPRAQRRRRSPASQDPSRLQAPGAVPSRASRRGRNPASRRSSRAGLSRPHQQCSSATLWSGPGTAGSLQDPDVDEAPQHEQSSRGHGAAADLGSRPSSARQVGEGVVASQVVSREDPEDHVPGPSPARGHPWELAVPGPSQRTERRESGPSADGVTAPRQPVGAFPPAGPGGRGARAGLPEWPVGTSGDTVAGLIRASLAPGTWETYERAWQCWEDWKTRLAVVSDDFEIPLLLFIGHCREEGWSVSRINSCVSGLAFGFRLRHLPDVTKSFLVVRALKGWRRSQSGQDDRRPVSFALLLRLGDQLVDVCASPWELRLFRLAFSLAFFGALRLGELVSPSVKRQGGLFRDDVDLFQDRVEFRIRRSKTDVEGRGRKVVLFAVPGCAMCPVFCLREYGVAVVGTNSPLLVHADGSFLSHQQNDKNEGQVQTNHTTMNPSCSHYENKGVGMAFKGS